jgi:hypothetical protein
MRKLLTGLLAAGAIALPVGFTSAAEAPGEPALATCFWEGPISTEQPTTKGFDGRNFNFPEESATYWLARFNLPLNAHLILQGRYPHGRYMSLNAYSDGEPTDALSDIAIKPRPGHINPFIPGALRDGTPRWYQVRVLNQEPPPSGSPRAPNTLYAKPGPGASIELLYRVYEPDPGLDLTGGTGLPRPVLKMADGSTVKDAAACAAINDPDRSIPVQTVPAATWQSARSTPPCDPETNPAYDPPRWERFFNLNYAQLAVVSDCTDEGRQARLEMNPEVRGGFYSNRDTAYIYVHLSRDFGPLLVVRGRLPQFARTDTTPTRMPDAKLRFWSLCTGESRVTTRTPDCLADHQVLDRSGRDYTVVVSRSSDRPPNARPQCGVAWLDWGNRGDGAGDRDYGLLIMRNMLASPDFDHAIQRVDQPGHEREVMGWFFPRSHYTTTAAFASRGCAGAAG